VQQAVKHVPEFRKTAEKSTDTARVNAGSNKPCHSDRSRSARDGAVEEPAVLSRSIIAAKQAIIIRHKSLFLKILTITHLISIFYCRRRISLAGNPNNVGILSIWI
jgi:hypothetical protein